MAFRLYDGVSLYPPSQLSAFGFNFVMKALWRITLEDNASDVLTVQPFINLSFGSHLLSGSGSAAEVHAYLDKLPVSLQGQQGSLDASLHLFAMALDPIGNQSAIVGFVPNKFLVKPKPAGKNTAPVPFKIVSGINNLLIEDTTTYASSCDPGSGFQASQTSLRGTFGQHCTSLQMTLYFKVTDNTSDYTFYLKHWKGGTVGLMLTMVINGDEASAITKYVDATEAEGGDSNLSAIALRNLDYASIDYHDYLKLGLNSIQLTIEPIDQSDLSECIYEVRALSLERG
jgi:hypothetical protein